MISYQAVARMLSALGPISVALIFADEAGGVSMAKFDGVIGKALLAVTETETEITLVFADNRYLFVRAAGGKLESESVPE